MKAVTTQTCQVKVSLFGKCGGESVALCQYCGKAFCAKHGVVLDDGQEICSRKECVAKKEDLAKHLLYKESVSVRNEATACGIGGCRGELESQCVRCKGYFCIGHVNQRQETIMEGMARVSRMATLCHHCWARRPIWTKT